MRLAPDGTLELTALTVDTLVLRNGTVMQGDLISVTDVSVSLNVKGKLTKMDRSRVERIVLGQRRASAKSSGASKK